MPTTRRVRPADAMKALQLRAMEGFLFSNVAGTWRGEVVSVGGNLHQPVERYEGVGWGFHPPARPFDSTADLNPARVAGAARENWLLCWVHLNQVLDRIARPEFHGRGWVEISGGGGQIRAVKRDAVLSLLPYSDVGTQVIVNSSL